MDNCHFDNITNWRHKNTEASGIYICTHGSQTFLKKTKEPKNWGLHCSFFMKKNREFFKVFEIKWYPKPCLSGGKTLGTKGTHWELEGNMLGTKEKWEKKSSPPPPPPPPYPKLNRKKKQGTLSACCAFPLATWNFLFPKLFVTIFGLGWYPSL